MAGAEARKRAEEARARRARGKAAIFKARVGGDGFGNSDRLR